MTVYNAAELEVYQTWMLRAQRNATRRAKSLVKKWLKAHPNWEVAELRKAVTQICQSVVGEYGEYASSIACDLYDACMGMNFPPYMPALYFLLIERQFYMPMKAKSSSSQAILSSSTSSSFSFISALCGTFQP